jgi:hypothetical protein
VEAIMHTSFVRLSLAVACAFLVASASPSVAQQGDGGAARKMVTNVKISGGKVQTPEYQISKSQFKARTRDWFRIETQYETKPDWVDELSFKYYVAVKAKDGGKGPKYVLFSGDVTYINIEAGKHKSDMYIHPSTLARYGDVERVAVVISVQGRMEAMESLPASNQRWWEQLTPVDGMLLNRMQTPFAMLYFDDYEAVKPVAGR